MPYYGISVASARHRCPSLGMLGRWHAHHTEVLATDSANLQLPGSTIIVLEALPYAFTSISYISFCSLLYSPFAALYMLAPSFMFSCPTLVNSQALYYVPWIVGL